MNDLIPDEALQAEVRATPARRLIAYGILLALGFLLIWIAFRQPPTLGWQVFLVGLGFVVLVAAEQLRRATRVVIRLQGPELRDSTGRLLAHLDNVVRVERGAFAFKPSNGFVLILREKASRAWLPGLWWRYGRRVGVGGAIPANSAKFMAEQIALYLAARENSG